MNESELRRRLDDLLEEYGGPIRPFMEAVVTWGRRSDLTDSLTGLDEPQEDFWCPTCKEILVCQDCEGLIDPDDCDCDEPTTCEWCGDDKVCASCDGYVKTPEEAKA